MGRPRNSPNKSARELKQNVEIAELKHRNKVLADENKKLKKKS